MNHEFDDDGVCIHCGFDGAEWHWWKYHTWEGRANPDAQPPLCKQEYWPDDSPTEKDYQ